MPEYSPHEERLTHAYWEHVGGTLYEELKVHGRRIDGVILPDGPRKRIGWVDIREVNMDGQPVIVVQTKAGRPTLSLLGQALLSPDLIATHWPRAHMTTVALCGRDDDVLRPLAEVRGIHVEIIGMDDVRSSGGSAGYSKDLLARYWQTTGGTLLERVELMAKSPTHDRQRARGIIVLGREHERLHGGKLSPEAVDGADIIVVYAGRTDGGMYGLGEALFTADLLRHHYTVASVRPVVACEHSDPILRPLAERRGIEINVL